MRRANAFTEPMSSDYNLMTAGVNSNLKTLNLGRVT